MNNFDGVFVTVEGLDGAGTTTLCDNLQRELEGWEFTQEPSTGKYGRIVREELKSESDPTLSDFFLFLADRYDHCQSLIGPKLDDGSNVISDRYNLSTYAYQTPVVEKATDVHSPNHYISQIVKEWVIQPDLTIVIDIPPEESLERVGGEREKYEKLSRLEKARDIYKYYTRNQDHVVEIDGQQSEEEVLEEALQKIDEIHP